MIEIHLAHGLAEYLRDALNGFVEGDDPAVAGIVWDGGTLVIHDAPRGEMPELELIAARGRENARHLAGGWELAVECEVCGEDEWSSDGKCHCEHVADPMEDNEDAWRE